MNKTENQEIKNAVENLTKLREDNYRLYFNREYADRSIDLAVHALKNQEILESLLNKDLKVVDKYGNSRDLRSYFPLETKIEVTVDQLATMISRAVEIEESRIAIKIDRPIEYLRESDGSRKYCLVRDKSNTDIVECNGNCRSCYSRNYKRIIK